MIARRWRPLVALVVLVAGCSRSSPGPPDEGARVRSDLDLVVTQVPAHTEVPAAGSPPGRRYPAGSRVAWIRSTHAGASVVRVLSEGLEAAGAPSVSFDGERVVFAGRSGPGDRWCLYEAALAGGAPRQVVDAEGDCSDPAYLAGDRIAFALHPSSRPDTPHLAVAHLDPQGARARVERITFGPGAAVGPSALADGRILFAMTGGEPTAALSLFTVNADGTMLEPFCGQHDDHGQEVLARPTPDARVILLTDTPLGPRVEWVAMSRPMGERTPWESGESGASAGLRPRSVSPLGDARLLLTGRPAGAPDELTSAVHLAGPGAEGTAELFASPEWDAVEAVAARPVETPRWRPSQVAPDLGTATLVCYDAGASDHRVGPGREAHAPTAVEFETLRPPSGSTDVASVRALGRFDVESDLSFHAELPADVPLRVRSLDADGDEIATSGWFWLRPGEVRACFGCHERRDTAPPNRSILAVSQEPRRLVRIEELLEQ